MSFEKETERVDNGDSIKAYIRKFLKAIHRMH